VSLRVGVYISGRDARRCSTAHEKSVQPASMGVAAGITRTSSRP